MPPPNAIGNLHIGHALDMNLKDILIRYKRMQGEDALFIPGSDHAGFETWVVYREKKLGRTRVKVALILAVKSFIRRFGILSKGKGVTWSFS